MDFQLTHTAPETTPTTECEIKRDSILETLEEIQADRDLYRSMILEELIY